MMKTTSYIYQGPISLSIFANDCTRVTFFFFFFYDSREHAYKWSNARISRRCRESGSEYKIAESNVTLTREFVCKHWRAADREFTERSSLGCIWDQPTTMVAKREKGGRKGGGELCVPALEANSICRQLGSA